VCDARYLESVKLVVLRLLDLLVVEFKRKRTRPSSGRKALLN
jgi:hypothetical protein